jgi:uncharacterized membrane protein YbhN (UPF0104 family)
MRPPRLPLRRALRVLFGVVGLAFLGFAFRETWDRSQQTVLPSPWHLTSAGALALGGVALASRGWAWLFEAKERHRALRSGFYTAQLGKYIPGAIWQAVGQVGLARGPGIPAARALTAFFAHAATQAAAGATVAALLSLVGTEVPLLLRLLSLTGLVLLFLLRRASMVRAIRLVGRLTRRAEVHEGLVPSQRGILCSYGWALVAITASGSAFAILASSVHAAGSAMSAIPAYAFAWTIGFLAIPFPAGVGIREAVLIATLGRGVEVAPVIAASLAHRLVTMLAELVMIVVERLRASRTKR